MSDKTSWILSKLLKKDTAIGVLVGFSAALIMVGYAAYPYVQAVNAIDKNKRRIKKLEKQDRHQSDRIENMQASLKDLNKTMRIVACANDDMKYTARNLLNCSEFD